MLGSNCKHSMLTFQRKHPFKSRLRPKNGLKVIDFVWALCPKAQLTGSIVLEFARSLYFKP